MADDQKIQLLKKAIRNLKAAVDVLSDREREQLKDLILKGQVTSEEELRAYLSRMIAARASRREQERKKLEERQRMARQAADEEEQAATRPDQAEAPDGDTGEEGDEEASIETEAPAPGTEAQVPSGNVDEPAKITGKVIDAKTRRPVPYVKVRVPGTSFGEETETTGVFIWEELPRGEQVNFECIHKDYKPCLIQYRTSLDDEQHVVIKMVPRERKGDKKPAGGGH